jgi:hypothetical protein
MRALTLPASRASIRFRLLSSSGQSGKTDDTNARWVPLGDQTGPEAPVEMRVSWTASPPSMSIVQICGAPERDEMKAIFRPSGDQRG